MAVACRRAFVRSCGLGAPIKHANQPLVERGLNNIGRYFMALSLDSLRIGRG